MASERIDLETRVRRLERGAARWRVLTGLCAGLLAWVLLTAQSGEPRGVEAGAFVVRDEAGVARAQLGMSEGVPALSLYDARGYLRAGLAVEADGPILNFFAADAEPRIVVGEREGAVFVVLRDATGAPRAAMAVQEDGSPSLYLLDDKLNPIWRQPGAGYR